MVKGEATMVEHTFDNQDMTGYFLPGDSQLLLKQLSNHIRFLARLAQPRLPDETQQGAPVMGVAEWMFCLDQLAEQLDVVLQALSWPARRVKEREAADAPQTAVGANADADADAADDAMPAIRGGFVFGVTLDQIDTLNRLVERIKAYGDAVSADGMADFAEGTLTMLGHTIFDKAVEVDEVLVEIEAQQMPQGTRLRFAVEEPRAAYGVEVPSQRAPMRCAEPAMGYPLRAYGSSMGGLLVH
jgi:hypothetical protein